MDEVAEESNNSGSNCISDCCGTHNSRYRHKRPGALIVAFAIIATVLMIMIAFIPFAEAATLESYDDYLYELPVSSGNNESSSDETFSTETSDEENPLSWVRPHETKSSYTDVDPIIQTVGDSIRPTILRENDTDYSYHNNFGIYAFERSDPTTMIFRNHTGYLVAQSNFSIESEDEIRLDKTSIVNSLNTLFCTSQLLYYEDILIGKFNVSTEFSSIRSPKISACIDSLYPLENLSFSIVWNVLFTEDRIRIDGQISEFSKIEGEQLSENIQSFEIIEPNELTDQSNMICTIDWSDANCGNLSLEIQDDKKLAKIEFPNGMAYIDPTIVGTSSSSYATSGSPFRNTVYYDGTYWFFYYNGSALLYLSSSDGGVSWASATELPCSDNYIIVDYRAFDVEIRDNHIAICWIDFIGTYDRMLKYMDGYISDNKIDWNERINVSYLPAQSSSCWFGGVAIDIDQTSYVSYSEFMDEGGDLFINIITKKKSKDASSFTPFANSFGPFDLPNDIFYPQNLIPWKHVIPQFISMDDGTLVLIVVEDRDETILQEPKTYIHFDTYVPDEGWYSADPISYQIGTNSSRISSYRDFSACGIKNNETHMALKKANDYLYYVRLSHSGCNQTNLSESGISWPSISIDAAGDLHVQFIKSYGVYELHTGPGGDMEWSTAEEMFGDISDNPSVLASGERLQARNFVSFVDLNTTPKDVLFVAIPLPADVMGPYGDPWSGLGINQEQPFDMGMSDMISPGNGLLHIFQTDFTIPVRGMDMELSHFYSVPQYFVENSSYVKVPYLYDQFPWCPMGDGWQLNLPWICNEYVHLWGGTKVAIKWDGDVFNNTKGQRFVLTRGEVPIYYTLDFADGMRVFLHADGMPIGIIANRQIYGDKIIGASVTFIYDPATTLLHRMWSVMPDRCINFSYTDGKLSTIEYAGRNINFTYSGTRLSSVTDPLNRTTTFFYALLPPSPTMLITSVLYPTQGYGYTDYFYDTISVGTEATAYVVSKKELAYYRAVYSYTAVDGVIKYTQVDEYSLEPRPYLKGSTEYNFDTGSKSMITTYFDYVEEDFDFVPMKQTITWYSPDGRIARSEKYDDLRSLPDIALSSQDNRGHQVYARDPLGNEIFSSFANSNTRNSFLRPGISDLTTSGKIAFDDFGDLIDDGWIHSSGGTAYIDDWLGNLSKDPSYNVSATTGDYYAALKLDPYGNGYTEVILECLVMIKSTDSDVRLILSDTLSTDVAGARFVYDSQAGNMIHYLKSDGTWAHEGSVDYSPNNIYRITLRAWQVSTNYYYELYVDGTHIDVNYSRACSNPLNFFRIDVMNVGTVKCAIVDDIKLLRDWDIVFNGLESGKFVEIYDNQGEFVGRKKASSSSVKFTFNASNEFNPIASIIVRNSTGSIELIDSYRMIWGGDEFVYSEPELLKSAIKKTRSGFNWVTTIMDDNTSIYGSTKAGIWGWVTDPDFVLSGSKYHHDGAATAYRHHSYYSYGPVIPPLPIVPSLDTVFIQYAYLPSDSYPTEIGLRYYYDYFDQYTHEGWTDPAHWGLNITYSNGVEMGPLPGPNQWVMLVTKATDINWPTSRIGGIDFYHYGGDVYWDKSAWFNSYIAGMIEVSGLSSGQKIEIRKPDGTLICSDTIQTQGANAKLDLYSSGINCFPLAAYFSIYNSNGDLEFETQVINDIYVHDEYQYSRGLSPFYSNPPAPDGFTNLPLGVMVYLDEAKTKSMETYHKYGFKVGSDWQKTCLIDATKVKNGTNYLTTQYEYDSYGNVIKVTDPTGAVLNSSYDTYGIYLLSTWMNVGGQNLSQRFSYYENGFLKNETDALGRITEYKYDFVGRITEIIFTNISASIKYSYDDENSIVTFYDENGTFQKTYYDEYGRVSKSEQFNESDSSYSWRSYSYCWNGKVEEITDSQYNSISVEYDYLRRVTNVWNPDDTHVSILYDDRNRTVITYDESDNMKVSLYDANRRIIQTTQYLNDKMIYVNMTYDAIGNLLTAKDTYGRMTSYQYDTLGRVTKITLPWFLPDSGGGGGEYAYEQYSYDDCGRVIQKRNANETITSYEYDIAGRLLNASIDSDHWTSYAYDANGNIIAAKHRQGDSSSMIETYCEYDSWDRLVRETTSISGDDYAVKYGYDNRSNVIWMNIDGGSWNLSYSYDEFDRIEWVEGSSTTIAEFTYNTRNQLTSITYGNGVITTYDYDSDRGWIDRIVTVKGIDTLLDLDYERDSTRRITSINTDRTEVYDDLGRLVYSNDTTAFGTMQFAYDYVGNREQLVWGSITTNYTYDSYGRITGLYNNSADITYSYDHGSRLSHKNDGTNYWTYVYDAENYLIKVLKNNVTVEEFFYDAFGRMIKSIQDGNSKVMIYSGSECVYDDGALHVYANGLHIAKKKGRNIYYYHLDNLGSVRLVTKGNSQVVFETDYLPFGQPFDTDGTEEFLFVDGRTTETSDLIHYGARYYDPDIGRFISPDAIPSTNRFAYCHNDPINRIDKNGNSDTYAEAQAGLSSFFDLLGDIVDFVVDAVCSYVEECIDTYERLTDPRDGGYGNNENSLFRQVVNAANSVINAVVDTWDNLDPGLKQWIMLGASIALSFTPLGPLGAIVITSVIDGTVTDMIAAAMMGDIGLLALSGLSFIPGGGGKALKGLGFVGKTGKSSSVLKGISKAEKIDALKKLTLEKCGKTYRCTSNSAKHIVNKNHIDQIAAKSGSKNLDETMNNIKKGWTNSKFKGPASSPDYDIYESTGESLRFIIDPSEDVIVSIHSF